MRKGAGDETASELKGFKRRVPFIVAAIFVCFGVGVTLYLFVDLRKTTLRTDASCSESNMHIAEREVELLAGSKKTYDLEFAKTPSQQEMGLSFRPCIPTYAALVFLFPTESKFGIWMKDMKFAIDVIWLDKNKNVVSIEHDMKPDTYPKVFYPKSDSRYVIELAAGQAKAMGVKEGDRLSW